MQTVSAEFWVALRNNGLSKDSLRSISKIVLSSDIFESCARGTITPEDATEIMMLQQESEYWIVRVFQSIFGF